MRARPARPSGTAYGSSRAQAPTVGKVGAPCTGRLLFPTSIDFERLRLNLTKTTAVGPLAAGGELASLEALDHALASEYGAHLAIMERRLEEALAASGFDGALVFAGEERRVFRDDAVYPFRTEPYFNAWLPLAHAQGSFLRLVPGERPVLVYRQVADYWEEPPADPSGYWTAHFDLRIARGEAELRALAKTAGRKWVAVGENAAEHCDAASVNDARFLAHLDYYRAFKTRYEIVCMRAAQGIAVRGHRAVAEAFAGRVSELELGQIFLSATQQRETELPYPSIIALNEHAATLHHRHLRKRPPAVVRGLLIDAGAVYNGYASDITRTYSASAGDDFAALIDAVDALQQAVCAEVRGGVDFVALNAHAHRLLAAVLRAHGIVKCSAEQALDCGLTRTFLPHGLGHLLGLTVHDAAGRQVDPQGTLRPPPAEHPALRLTRVLEPGFVVTIEPGLYFIPSLIRAALAEHEAKLDRAKLERLLPFGGIRIEDDVEVVIDGARNLTREAFAAAARGERRAAGKKSALRRPAP